MRHGTCLCRAEVKSLAIGRECRESLKRFCCPNGRRTDNLMLFRIVYNYVGLAVEDLHPVFVVGMKALAGLIDREGYVFPRWMLRGIDQRRDRLIGLRI